MPLDFGPSDLAKSDFDAKMATLREKDAALSAASAARDAAAADLAAKETAVTDAEAAVMVADQAADKSFGTYTAALGGIGVTPAAGAPTVAKKHTP